MADSNMSQISTFDPNLSAICELLRGMKSGNELLTLLTDPLSNHGDLISATNHAMSILSAINNSISMLSCVQKGYQTPTNSLDYSFSEDWRNYDPSFDAGGTAISLLGVNSSHSKGRRKHSWTKMASILVDDGYAWRKYGQKKINHTTHPRSYYKCTHSPRCEALKQVQKIDDKPTSMYKIIYTNHHTCKKERFASPNYTEARTINSDSSYLINFASAENIESDQARIPHGKPFPANWFSKKQEDVSEKQFVSPLDPATFQISEYLNDIDEAPTSSETVVSNNCYLDESNITMDTIDYNSYGLPSFISCSFH